MDENPPRTIAAAALPDVISRYLQAHRAHDTATAITAFTDGATVVDDGRDYPGTAAIEKWLTRPATEYTYTTELIGAQEAGAAHYIATQRLEGDFPGGAVVLRYQFRLRHGLIERLVIEP